MEKLSFSSARPVPVNPDSVKGLPPTSWCTDIVAPELMDTEVARIYSYRLSQAPTTGINLPEPGFGASHLESPKVSSPPARANFIGRLARRVKTS